MLLAAEERDGLGTLVRPAKSEPADFGFASALLQRRAAGIIVKPLACNGA